MEIALNFAWAVLAACMLRAWVRRAPRQRRDRRMQMIALALAILILLPAISMTDDLAAAQCPAVLDLSVRRSHDHDAPNPHSILPHAATLPPAEFSALPLPTASRTIPAARLIVAVKNPALAAIDNRPPPAACLPFAA